MFILFVILLIHLDVIARGVCCAFCMTLSHLRTHMRWVDSDSRMHFSLACPHSFAVGFGSSLFSGRMGDMHPAPRIWPIVVGQHSGVGHSWFIIFHISSCSGALHSNIMCSRFSTSSVHSWHFALCS